MGSLSRLFPFVWRQRQLLVLSVVYGIVVATTSVLALALVFPVVKVLLLDQGFDDYLKNEVIVAKADVDRNRVIVIGIEQAIASQKKEAAETQTAEDLAQLRRAQAALRSAEWNHARHQKTAELLLPWIPRDRFRLLSLIMGALLIVTAIKCWMSYLQDVAIGSIVQRITQALRRQLFRRTLEFDQQTLAVETTPRLMSRFTFDLQQLSFGLWLLGCRVAIEPLKIVGCVIGAFYVNWRLTTLSFVCAPLAGLLFGRFGRRLKQASRRQMESMSRIHRVLSETLDSFRTVQAFRNERLHRRRLAVENADYFSKAMKIVRIDSMANPTVEFLGMTAVFIASLPGAYLVLRHKTAIFGVTLTTHVMDAAELALLYTMLAGILDPARKLSAVYSKVKKATAACDRIFEWMDRRSKLTTPATTIPLPPHKDAIEFQNVTFRYAVADETAIRPCALDNVSVRIPFGATVAVVGGNGSGKSTLVNLLPRFFDADSGRVLIDGTDICQVDPRDVRSQIGFVTQETLLFDRTIAENIEYGLNNASREQVELAAKRAHVWEFARQMPDGLETPIGDRGHRLSGGQRQRVAFARALIRDPAILILDEATSAVDAQSEQLIHSTLRDEAGSRTTLIVTHAMTTTLLEFVTHVLVMDNSRAIAFGRHEEVLATCPVYQRLFDAQSHRRAA